jgi:hypothetical protein
MKYLDKDEDFLIYAYSVPACMNALCTNQVHIRVRCRGAGLRRPAQVIPEVGDSPWTACESDAHFQGRGTFAWIRFPMVSPATKQG